MEKNKPEDTIRGVVDSCADCDVCRFLMDTSCLMFPELYSLFDKEMETGEEISSDELRNLVDLCNLCALCPCPNIREDVMHAKAQFIERDGLKLGIRIIEDVERIGKLCGAFPRLANALFRSRLGGFLKRASGIHGDRRFPEFPDVSFPVWAKAQKLDARRKQKQERRVAYFAGCTGGYLFPDVPKAVVEVFQNNGIEVYYPDQKCCGVPTLLEGDRRLTMRLVRFNVDSLIEAVEDGFDIVCSCSTCGYMLKSVLKENAYYSQEYQESVGMDETYYKIPVERESADAEETKFTLLHRSAYKSIFKDEGYFSFISPLKRIKLAESTYDVGEYLLSLHRAGELKTAFGPVSSRMAYYPPCHLREQKIGMPYLDLLRMIPGINIESIEGSLYCCGISGIMGFKREFYDSSIKLGSRLMKKINDLNSEKLVTDCLSCRLQFNQLTPCAGVHPIEILKESYASYRHQKG
jgi:glycerol-3-phosphate dehydrogenase subunit C